MKFSAWIVALLVLAVGMPAFATVGDTQWWKTSGPGITGSETSVKTWWNNTFKPGNPNPTAWDYDAWNDTDNTNPYTGNWEQKAERWFDHQQTTITLSLEVAGYAPHNTMGWQEITWDSSNNKWALGSKSGVIVPGGATAVSTYSVPIVPVSNFVFFLGSDNNQHATWYTMDSLNTDTYNGTPYRHAWVFNDPNPPNGPASLSWVVAWEDVAAGSADNDHNDMIVRFSLSAGGGGSGPPVPEIPPTLLAGVIPVIALAMRRFRK